MKVRAILWATPLLLAAAPLPATDAAIVRAVLAASARGNGPQCVERATTFPAFSVERELLGRSNAYANADAAGRAAAIRRRARPIAGDWRGEGRTLDARALQDVADATGPLLERAVRISRTPDGIAPAPSLILTPDLLANGQRLGRMDGRCTTLTLSPVHRRGRIALVDILRSSGPLSAEVRRWALRFDGKGWRPFASGMMRVS